MSTQKQRGTGRAGEAGHQGHDRQPAGDGVSKSAGGTPDAAEAATPKEVAGRSAEATHTQGKVRQAADIAHPGPDRFESEKSKGDLHHNQHETEKDMQDKVEKI